MSSITWGILMSCRTRIGLIKVSGGQDTVSDYRWVDDERAVDLDELSNLYRIAPLGHKEPAALGTVMGDQGDPVSFVTKEK